MMSDEMDEIWALYADDGAQALDAMESALMALGRADGGAEAGHISALFRAVHTFKGNSRVLGLAVVEGRAHLAEDLIGLVRDEGVPFDAELRELLLLTADTLRTMLEETAATHADVGPGQSDDLMVGLADKIARCRAVSAVPPPSSSPPPPPEPVAPPECQPAVVIDEPMTHAPVDEPVSQAAVLPATPVRRLADDPVYRDIFRTMANEAMTKLRASYAQFAVDPEAAVTAARAEADALGHAARQMGLEEWLDPLSRYAAQTGCAPDSLAELLLRLDELSDTSETTTAEEPETAQADVMFAALGEPLAVITRFGANLTGSEQPARTGLVGAVTAVCDAVAGLGFVRVAEAAERLVAADGVKAYRAAELRLYEELSAVEATLPEAAAKAGISPRRMLQTCCAENVFETLATLNGILDRMRASVDPGQHFEDFERSMRLVFHACSHFKLDSAAQLAMSLVDLFARKHAAGSAPDPILIHIARRFVETVELVFDAVGEGQTPDTGTIERLFEEAASACFISGGLMSASAIERRLGLPKEFHRVLSPESVRAASGALERGLRFYVIRTDINDDEKLAETFLDWISTGETCAITNVTVFQGNRTLFDFLIATPLCESDLTMALAEMDPGGHHVCIDTTLSTLSASDAEAPEAGDTPRTASASVTSEMLEQISEISAGQSMVNHMLTRLAEADLSEALYSAMRQSGDDWERARAEVRRIGLEFTTNLQEVALAEAHLSAQMAQLQRETVAIRSRPANTVFRSLEAFVGTRSRRNGREVRLTASGGDCQLDVTLLDSLRKVLRGLVTIRLDKTDSTPRAFHVALHLDEERVLITMEDDGGPQSETTYLNDLASALRRSNGSLRGVLIPGGGMRFHIVLPLSMRVLEGMVVGVDGVRYVVPVDAIRAIVHLNDVDTFRVAADQDRKMVRISSEEIVAVHSLMGESGHQQAETGGRRVYVVLGRSGQSVAIPVDELVGQQLVLLRPLQGVLARLQNLTGLAMLSGGEVGLVLSANRICAAANDGEQNSAVQRI